MIERINFEQIYFIFLLNNIFNYNAFVIILVLIIILIFIILLNICFYIIYLINILIIIKKKYSQISYKNIFENKRVVNMEEEMIWRVWDIF